MSERPPILLVDDSENDLMLMRLAAEEAGFPKPLQEVHNGEEAIAYLSGSSPFEDRTTYPLPEVMLLDLNMPRKNGFDVLNWIRAQPTLRGLNVMVLTASAREDDIRKAFALGANFYLVKPLKMEDLIQMLRCLREWLSYSHFPPSGSSVQKTTAAACSFATSRAIPTLNYVGQAP